MDGHHDPLEYRFSRETLAVLEKYAQSAVPRYTSYPTAVQFSDKIDEKVQAAWLRELDTSLPLSLYLHIPFCHQMCWYCGCHTAITKRYERAERYFTALMHEIETVSQAIGKPVSVGQIHLGGGTPTYLSADHLAELFKTLRAKFNVIETCDIDVEADPRTLDTDRIDALAKAGVTRVSLGAQDFDPDVQQMINRVQPFDQVAEVARGLRKAGVPSINLDLMYGLPGQTLDSVMKSVDLAASLMPDRLAVFGYAHVPWFKKNQKAIDESRLPAWRDRLAQAHAIRDRLVSLGYEALGLDHFAKPTDPMVQAFQSGDLKRNFQGYTADTCDTVLGFGASAISTLPQGYVQNVTDIKSYEQVAGSAGLAGVRGVAFSDDDRRRAAFIRDLMCYGEVSLATSTEADASLVREAKARLEPLLADGLAEIDAEDILAVTALGQPFVRNVAACFDGYLTEGSTRHSRAV